MPPKRAKAAAAAAVTAAAAEPDPAPAAAQATVDYSKLTVAALREECKTKGLDASGTKAVLVSRLQAAPASASSAAPAAAPAAPAAEPAPAKRGRKNKKEDEGEAAAAAPEEESKPKGKRGKTAKKEEQEAPKEEAAAAAAAPLSKSEMMAALKGKTSSKLRKAAVDSLVPGAATFAVYSSPTETYDCMLNQTNIGQNNNKYYVIQVLTRFGQYFAWNRWGRVGEPGQNKLESFGGNVAAAVSSFEKKFKDKTSNHWSERDNFVKVPGKYDLVDMDGGEEEQPRAPAAAAAAAAGAAAGSGKPKKVKACTLEAKTAKLVKLLFDHDMFREAMANMEIDVQKMPLGKISKAQLAKGYEVLEQMKDIIISGAKKQSLPELSSRFYTIVPHSFGRSVPPVINTFEMLQKKMDMLEMLGDIEMALGMEHKDDGGEEDEVPNPIDENYKSLHCGLTLVDRGSEEFQKIMQYLNATMEGRHLSLQEIWRVDRSGEAARFAEHEAIKERKLLWHGTNVAVVAAILKTGLRIMPHSGGRVGKGIYFASENAKSAGYVRTVREDGVNMGIMFLAEVALGKEHHITMDDWRLTHPPKGYDSIVAKGSGEPDPSKDTTLVIDGHAVTVPQGKRIAQPQFSGSNFDKSEYLIYKESQHRIRYLLKLKF